jgi:hydrogenase large subunit
MSNRIVLDPVTRLEGHLRVEITVDSVAGQQQVVDARIAGTSFRGYEQLLVGRDPTEAPHLTQRICGVCSVPHGVVSAMALENASRTSITNNAVILRNLVMASNFIQSHVIHFYHMSLLDFIAGPAMPPWQPSWNADRKINSSDTSRLMENYKAAIKIVRQTNEMAAIFAGRQPHSPAIISGGFTQIPTTEKIDQFRSYAEMLSRFVRTTYIPDVEFFASQYPDCDKLGRGFGNFIAFGAFDQNGSGLFFPGGRIVDAKTDILPIEPNAIREQVAMSWFQDDSAERHPDQGVTNPAYPKDNAYSWIKSPRYESRPFETGPLARLWIKGQYRNGISVNDRHKARALETLSLLEALPKWLDKLETGKSVYTSFAKPSDAAGAAMTEAPRGALGHWVRIANGKISSYQVITPTCWNASPRDKDNKPGPMEQAVIGTPVQDPAQPVEVLRIVHSFDPCLACAVH